MIRNGLAFVAGALAIVTGCSSTASSSGKASAASTSVVSNTTNLNVSGIGWKRPVCKRPVASAPVATPVKGTPSDFDLKSFDGTTIRIHWFPLKQASGATAPTILMGPGWSLPGDTNAAPNAGVGVQNVTSIGALRKAGYNVATWDPRGFGKSTGTVEVDSASDEARDVSTYLDWIARQKGVQLDAPGDPRVGMVGMSYGGGIQFVTAATDCRIDVITPTIAWNNLSTSLYQSETVKSGWAGLLVSIAKTATLDPHILSANAASTSSGVLSQDDRQWFVDRGPDNVLSQIHIPTLIVQGTVDNLFPLGEGERNYVALAQNHIPLAMTWFCGGHGVCLTPADPKTYVQDAVMNWLARYLKSDTSAPVVPAFQTVDQNGKVHRYASYPPPETAASVFAFSTKGSLALQPNGGSGPLTSIPGGQIIGSLAKIITPGKASMGLDVPITVSGSSRMLLGAPQLRLGYSCSLTAPATKPTRIFAQIVDDKTSHVLGNQVMPIVITCDGLLHEATTELESVAQQVHDGDRLTLQLVATSVAYAVPQMGGTVDFARIELTIPAYSNG